MGIPPPLPSGGRVVSRTTGRPNYTTARHRRRPTALQPDRPSENIHLMTSAPPQAGGRRRAILAWGSVWLAVVVVFISQNVVRDISYARPIRWWNDGLFEALYWLPFVLATPLFAYMGGNKTHKASLHIMVGVSFALVQPFVAGLLTNAAAGLLFAPDDPRIAGVAEGVRRSYAVLVLTALWKYVVIIAVCLAVRYYRATQEARLRSAQLERQVAAAELGALKMQVHPHFLFNALHSAAMLTVVDPRRAHEVLVQLADLLRTTLDKSMVLEVPLQEELDFLDRYLAIERIRFEDRLAVRFDVGAGTERLLVPSLILQPIVENALRHGLAPKQGPGLLTIHSRLLPDVLELEVSDDGVGLQTTDGRGGAPTLGVGLTNVQDRVNAANQRPTPIAIASNGAGGTRVTLQLPVRSS